MHKHVVKMKCMKYTRETANHSKSDVSLLERGSIISTVAGDSHHFTVGVEATVNDAFDQRVLVLR